MPNDKTNKLPDDGDIKRPTPPENPVEYAKWLQRPRVSPKQPEVQPDDSALRPKGLKQPDINRSIGTDKPKRPKKKNPNNTRLPSYLKPNKGRKTPSEAPEVKVVSLMKFLDWFKKNNLDTQLSKLSVPSIAGFGLGWYLSDNLTRDEKQRTERNLEREWEKAIERAEQNQRAKPKKSKARTAFDKLNDFYKSIGGA